MPQEIDGATGNLIVPQSARADPAGMLAYRGGISAADGTTKPAAGSALFAQNPGYRQKCRVFVTSTGSPTSCTLRPYVRSGGTSGQVGTGAAQTLAGAPNFDTYFDVQTDGDDLAVLVETLAGGTSPTVSIFLSWR
ncbi:MAG TPA: hypothetical protein VKV26_06620 [Dehalococcoidia bacterium]|nr:hypothetical protein [Dehalococcoidia bacterium]